MEFKYGIGQILTTVEAGEMIKELPMEMEVLDRTARLPHYTVIERQSVECNAGVQLFYGVSHRVEGGKHTIDRMNEILLVPYPHEKMQILIDEFYRNRMERITKRIP